MAMDNPHLQMMFIDFPMKTNIYTVAMFDYRSVTNQLTPAPRQSQPSWTRHRGYFRLSLAV
jgi:hypothetical protein